MNINKKHRMLCDHDRKHCRQLNAISHCCVCLFTKIIMNQSHNPHIFLLRIFFFFDNINQRLHYNFELKNNEILYNCEKRKKVS